MRNRCIAAVRYGERRGLLRQSFRVASKWSTVLRSRVPGRASRKSPDRKMLTLPPQLLGRRTPPFGFRQWLLNATESTSRHDFTLGDKISSDEAVSQLKCAKHRLENGESKNESYSLIHASLNEAVRSELGAFLDFESVTYIQSIAMPLLPNQLYVLNNARDL
jgi:hypothetical protein